MVDTWKPLAVHRSTVETNDRVRREVENLCWRITRVHSIPPSNSDDGVLLFYLTSMRSSRRICPGKSQEQLKSHCQRGEEDECTLKETRSNMT
ncbi:hypothetical protein Leryth_003502 [Lithospermum erythrorhizon]|nr:hypothetical protein Leryth_003502 [Lithospermum erythrorhizon]